MSSKRSPNHTALSTEERAKIILASSNELSLLETSSDFQESLMIERATSALREEVKSTKQKKLQNDMATVVYAQAQEKREAALRNALKKERERVSELLRTNGKLGTKVAAMEVELKNKSLEVSRLSSELKGFREIDFEGERQQKRHMADEIERLRRIEIEQHIIISERDSLIEQLEQITSESRRMEASSRTLLELRSTLDDELDLMRKCVREAERDRMRAEEKLTDNEQNIKCLLEINKNLDEDNTKLRKLGAESLYQFQQSEKENQEAKIMLLQVSERLSMAEQEAGALRARLNENERYTLRFVDKAKQFAPSTVNQLTPDSLNFLATASLFSPPKYSPQKFASPPRRLTSTPDRQAATDERPKWKNAWKHEAPK